MHSAEPETLGPYRIQSVLGHGGMGVVFLATGPDGRSVAVKTVRLNSEDGLQSLRREIHTLSRLRHPQVVRIFDHGLHEGRPWYAMELLEGQPLRRYASRLHGKAETQGSMDPTTEGTAITSSFAWSMASQTRPQTFQPAPPEPEPQTSTQPRQPAAGGRLQEVLRLARRICSPLAFLHGEGLVHRDLKLDNILLRSEERGARSEEREERLLTPDSLIPVLVDFGLSSQFSAPLSREVLEVGFWSAGTVHTIAPEQILGELVDARADLYALGCLLYELLTGRPPFTGGGQNAILQGHLKRQPAPPSVLVEGIPDALDALVLRLLEKRPRDRLGHADDVAAALEVLGSDAFELEGAPAPRAYLHRPGLAGRREPLAQLNRHLVAAQQGESGFVWLAGESGVGKTRLALETAREASRSGIQVTAGECRPPSAGDMGRTSAAPLHPLRGFLRSLAYRCREKGQTETRDLFQGRSRLLAPYEPELVGLPGQELEPEPPEVAPDAARQRLYVTLAEVLSAAAHKLPMLLVLDDLQWADELTLGFLRHLLQTAGPAPFLILGTFRSEELAGPEQTALQALRDHPRAVRLELSRLDETAVASMVADMLALEPAPQVFSRFLARHSEGNPFFVAEYLRSAVEQRVLYRNSSGYWRISDDDDTPATETFYEKLQLPRSLRELVGRRLQGLGSGARWIAEAAAVLGREFEEPLLAVMVAELGLTAVLEGIEQLLARQILEEPRLGSLRFAHDKLREETLQHLEPERQALLHRQAALTIEAQPEQERERLLAVLGHHWEQAGDRLRASQRYRDAARQARDRYAHREAQRLYRACLRLASLPPPQSIALRNELGTDVLGVQDGPAAALAEHRQALQEARQIQDLQLQADSLARIGLVSLRLGRPEEGRLACREALELCRKLGDQAEEGVVLRTLGSIESNLGHLDASAELFQQAIELHQITGKRRDEGVALGNLASVRRRQGRMDEAQALYQQALRLHRETGNRLSEGAHLGNLANVLSDQGRLDEAAELYTQARALHVELGNQRDEGIVLSNLANLRLKQSRTAEARTLYERALAIAVEVGNRRQEGVILGNLAVVHQNDGRLQEAQRLLEQALALHRQVGNLQFEGWVLRDQGRFLRQAGLRLDLAAQSLDQAERIARDIGDQLGLGLCLCERSALHLAWKTSGREALDAAQSVADALGSEAASWLGERIEMLHRAQIAFEADPDSLVNGELLAELPAALRQVLQGPPAPS